MLEVKEIEDLREYYENDLYGKVRTEQNITQTYINETFKVPEIKTPKALYRSGLAYRMVNSPAEQIITSNPQALLESGNKEIDKRINKEVNQNWFEIIKRQNPNPLKEFVKNLLARGEAYFWLLHNEKWVTNQGKEDEEVVFDRRGLPVLFLVPDPMIIYGSREEDDNGIPEKIFIIYDRPNASLIRMYPEMKDKLGVKGSSKWVEFWDDDTHYCAIDTDVLKHTENIYKRVPFIRKYSGFGRNTHDGDLSQLIMDDLRMSRDLLREECAIRSDINTTFHLFAHKRLDLIIPSGATIDEEAIRNSYDYSAGSFNILGLPEGSKFGEGVQLLPSTEVLQHFSDVRNELYQRNPFLMAGSAVGANGRQQDMAQSAAMRRYDTVLENTENALSTAIEMSFNICNTIPTLLPEGLKSGDLDKKFSCSVSLKAHDPVESDRLSTLGDRLWNRGDGCIDLKTNLITYQGYSIDEADDIIANILVDKLTIQNPDVAMVMGTTFAQEAGMMDFINAAKMARQQQQAQGKALSETPSPSAQERSQGETRTPLGQELVDVALSNRGARQAPDRYIRGG